MGAITGREKPSPKITANSKDNAIYAPMSGTSRRKFNNVTELLDDFDYKADNFTIPSSDDQADGACLDMASLYSRRPKDLFDNNVVSPACSRLCSCANTKSAPITAAQALPLAAAASS